MNKKLALHVYHRLMFGRKEVKYSNFEFRRHPEELAPTVFLSTGRCGTAWLSERLDTSRTHASIHDPYPVMRAQGALMHGVDFNNVDAETMELLKEIFLAGREEMFVLAKRSAKELALIDSRGTFFAYVIAALFPKAKFVFLHRHPVGVVRSGLRRGWYAIENDSALNRITPGHGDPMADSWAELTPTEKIAWSWRETNRWIMEFLTTISAANQHELRFDDWTTETIGATFDFMGADVKRKSIDKHLNVKSNVQRSGNHRGAENWSEQDERRVKEICGDVARQLNYSL